MPVSTSLKVVDGCSYYTGKDGAIQECPDGQITGVLGVGRRFFTIEPFLSEAKPNDHKFTEIRSRRDIPNVIPSEGFFVSDPVKHKTKSKRGEFVCNGPYCEYYKVAKFYYVVTNWEWL